MLDHVITDGVGLGGVVGEILNGANGDEEPLPEPLEAHVDINLSTSFVLSMLKDKLMKRLYKDGHKPKLGFTGPLILGDSLPTVNQTYMGTLCLGPECVVNAKRQCREEKTTMHGFISAACSKSLHSLARSDIECKLLTPISLRNRGPFGKVLGNYVSGSETIYTVDNSISIWDLARTIKASITPGTEREWGMVNLRKDLRAYFANEENQYLMGRMASMEVSNLGVCETSADWYFTQGNHHIGPLINVNVVTTSAGKMFFTATARSMCVDRDALDAFMRGIKAEFDNL